MLKAHVDKSGKGKIGKMKKKNSTFSIVKYMNEPIVRRKKKLGGREQKNSSLGYLMIVCNITEITLAYEHK